MNQDGTAARGELVHVEQAPMSRRALLSKEQLKEEAQQRQLLGQYVKEQMTAGTDFGVIPGTDKPTLLKPGAEKLVDLYRCYAEYICVAKTEDFDKPLFAYEFKSRIIHRESGSVVAEGVGSCNSREGKYRWRNGERKCPKCSKAGTLKKSKSSPGKRRRARSPAGTASRRSGAAAPSSPQTTRPSSGRKSARSRTTTSAPTPTPSSRWRRSAPSWTRRSPGPLLGHLHPGR
jgi:hypothetical protein